MAAEDVGGRVAWEVGGRVAWDDFIPSQDGMERSEFRGQKSGGTGARGQKDGEKYEVKIMKYERISHKMSEVALRGMKPEVLRPET